MSSFLRSRWASLSLDLFDFPTQELARQILLARKDKDYPNLLMELDGKAPVQRGSTPSSAYEWLEDQQTAESQHSQAEG